MREQCKLLHKCMNKSMVKILTFFNCKHTLTYLQVPSIAFETPDTTVLELNGSVEICVRVQEGIITSESSFTLSTIAVSAGK